MKAKKILTLILALMLVTIFGATSIFAGGTKESAEKYPAKSITYIIPFNPGGQSDITAQYQKDDLEKVLGVNIVIKYMPGAGGAVAWSNLVKAKPDGYTICGNNIPHIIVQPLARKNAGYKTDQLVPVYMFETTPIGLAVLKSSPFKTLDDFLAYAKKHPEEITIGGSGTYTGHHLALLQLQKLTGTKFTYIPSTGAAPSVANFLGGHTQALFANSNDLVQHKDKIRILAMGTEKRFKPYFPDVPTFKELGINMTAGIDRGVCVPPETPDNVIKTLEDAFDKVCNGDTFVNKMTELGFLVRHLKSKEFKKYIEQKTEEYTQILKDLGVI
ncbi:MAG: tripartite tricarboxylate transporter substrate binding protein [Spirochaetes bacterium]|nr:MAG: tripartite tricarboxylate transporter substrate binding protein [Spirochaetota bacterium]